MDIERYRASLRAKGLPDIPFHAIPLLNGHDAYEGMDLATRKRLLSSFRVFFRRLPVRYGLVVLKMREHANLDAVAGAMHRRMVDFLFDNLAYLQGADEVKIYYDDGQRSIVRALHKVVDYALSKNAVAYRVASAADYRLSQAADYICTMEITVLKYRDKTATLTDEKFFDSWSQFKKGIFKEV